MEYFVLQMTQKLDPKSQTFSIKGFRDQHLGQLPAIEPTLVSMGIRQLEWMIPNTAFNQAWVNKHFQSGDVYRIIEKPTLVDMTSKKMPGLPPAMDVVESKPPARPKKEKPNTKAALEKRKATIKLKADLTEKLTAQDIDVPQGAKIEELQELVKALA